MKPVLAALALGALSALFLGAPVRAQVCDVRPIDRRIRPCINENQECSPPPGGMCITTPIPGSPPGIDCICTGTSPDDEEPPEPTPQPEPERPKKKKCLGSVSQALVPDVPGLPAENTLVTYTTLVDPANVARAFIDERLVAAFFGADSTVEGQVTLYYGSFADPAHVPVELVALSIRLPSVPTFGFRSGPQVLALPTEGLTPAVLVYDADERYLASSPQLGIELAGNSRFALGIEAVVTIYAAVAPDGVLRATAVGIADAPLLAIPNPQRVNVGDAGRPGSGDSLTPDVSAGGRYVAFSSASPNFVANDTNGLDDVFLRDRATGALFRVSQTAAGGQADGASFDPAVSADGRFVAFTSVATNLDPADAHADADVYLYDAHTRQLRVLSRPAGGGAAGAGSFRPDVSDDGRYVAFSSRRDDLVMGDDNGAEDVFVYEIATGALRRVSVDDAGGEAGGDSQQPALSADGRYVVFQTFADDLFAADGNSAPDVVVHDRDVDNDGVFDEAGAIATIPVSVTSSGAQSTPNFVGAGRITPASAPRRQRIS